MDQAVWQELWRLIRDVLLLKASTFRAINDVPESAIIALIVVLVAGLSQEIAQSIILFVNRVKPIRFVFSLLIGSILFTFGYIFLVFSTWVITLTPLTANLSLGTVARILGFSYVPLIFSFLGALPYLGIPILSLLSVWHLLAMVVGFASVTSLSLEESVIYVLIGWVVLQILQQTIGQPLANLGRTIANQTAGVKLATSSQDIFNLLQDGLKSPTKPMTDSAKTSLNMQAYQVVATGQILARRLSTKSFRSNRHVQTVLGLIGIGLVTLLVVLFIKPITLGATKSLYQLPRGIKWLVDLVWIGIIGLIVGGLLAPLETLGWWAGWYNDEIDTTINTGELARPLTSSRKISRYIIYLDGIGQSSFNYLPDVEVFLQALTEVLPKDMALIRGIMPYSVVNNPLDQDRPLAFFWRLADKLRFKNPASILGLIVNIRNVLTVAVSADQRYGPLYNQGIAQVMYNALLNHGYNPYYNVPITLIGYSGGGQMSTASAPFLGRSLKCPIEIISLGGVISGNCNILKLEHLYHLVGDKDSVERLGPVMFPGRWKIFPLSYWNRAKRRGKISIIPLGPVGHNVPDGMMDPGKYLADGRSYLQQTLDTILCILQGNPSAEAIPLIVKSSNYLRYQKAAFNRFENYPINQSLPSAWYQPIAPWMGRLILPKPEERSAVRGALLEVYHAPKEHSHLVGQVVSLRLSQDVGYLTAVTKDVHFSEEALYTNQYEGLIHPIRLDQWKQVNPLESLAGSHPFDDIVVMLPPSVHLQGDDILVISSQPIQITGRFYALVKFIGPLTGDEWQVQHFNPTSGQFDGLEEIVSLPEVITDENGIYPSTVQKLETSPQNIAGWYIYGAQNHQGKFVVQSWSPRDLHRLTPQRVLLGFKPSWRYLRRESWANLTQKKGHIESVLLAPKNFKNPESALEHWQEGDYALLIHIYGGIGGLRAEPATKGPIYFGHFAYGIAQVVKEPLTQELRFNIRYYQVYTHNTDGLVAGALAWNRYMGDRQFGWLGTRPTEDILLKFAPFTEDFDFEGTKVSGLRVMADQLEAMTARYRIGDGTGGTYVGPANNCSQDSNRALFASLGIISGFIKNNETMLADWLSSHPHNQKPLEALVKLEQSLLLELQFFGRVRTDWQKDEYNLGSTLEDEPFRNLWMGLGSWRTMLPRLASDTIVKIFLQAGASVWVLRTNQVGGFDPEIEPVAPNTL